MVCGMVWGDRSDLDQHYQNADDAMSFDVHSTCMQAWENYLHLHRI